MVPSSPAALLALADQRLPSGGHVHSGGVEQAIADGVLRDLESLEPFLERRVRTTGRIAAGLAAATAATATEPDATERLPLLDAETEARTPSPAQRVASRAQGRGLLRLAVASWAAPSRHLSWTTLGTRPHHPLVLGCAAAASGVGPGGAALVAAYLCVSGSATAAQRLLALDPVSLAAMTLRLGHLIEEVAEQAHRRATEATSATDLPENGARWLGLPDDSDPWLDLLAERHAAREERLFAS
jgi:urease accessory protein